MAEVDCGSQRDTDLYRAVRPRRYRLRHVPQAAPPGTPNSTPGGWSGRWFCRYNPTFAHEIGHLYECSHVAVAYDSSRTLSTPTTGSKTSIGKLLDTALPANAIRLRGERRHHVVWNNQ